MTDFCCSVTSPVFLKNRFFYSGVRAVDPDSGHLYSLFTTNLQLKRPRVWAQQQQVIDSIVLFKENCYHGNKSLHMVHAMS
jgi:hypothetical protein